MRVSTYFRLGKSQHQLDFVDVELGKDLPVYVDPYAISIPEDDWFVEANNLVVSFFSLIIDNMSQGNFDKAKELLSNLGEPEGTYIGMSKDNPNGKSGRGVGDEQSDDLFEKLMNSEAVKTGSLTDLSDCELLIPGIGPDKISDITINIIRGKLVEYTYDQCILNNIPVMHVPCPPYWDSEAQDWVSRYHELPIYKGRPLIFIPKAIVRLGLMINAQSFYRHGVLEFLKRESLNANSSLVKVLKNGERVVYKKDLEEQHPFSKTFLYEFSQEHPEVLEEYKSSIDNSLKYITDSDLENRQLHPQVIDYDAIIEDLRSIPKGRDSASRYHNAVFGILELLLYPMLRTPKKEAEILEGRKRIDIRFNNGFTHGFFGELYRNYQIKAPFIFFECKNYRSELANPEFDQITGRFSKRRGQLGFITCREIEDRSYIVNHCRDIVGDGRGHVIVLEDADLVNLLNMRRDGLYPEISDYFDHKLREILI
ncbi:hypothetical protein [Deinococcus ruber]|uniref:Restriction endonuclease type IV Mrr domain-containing protein n=1 Tax=Deinococcus ruber TaxID=1848197 RepID=A0A918F8R3_9DEIO|nr:hypothetical protein [Deinococcus ruber]GGR11174.1 hypothetical protein GCM10008957_24800 [Deinococcus ruber]